MKTYATGAGLCLIGALLTFWLTGSPQPPFTQAEDPARENPKVESLTEIQADVTRLKDKASDQAHAMASVAYHFNNMWFAAQAENWPLTQFYWNETRSHLRWAVRIIPIRKDAAGQEIKLQAILEAVENSPLKQLQLAIEKKDSDSFVAAYKFMIESCYACHKASDKPYLLPQIPTHPAEPTINFDPEAKWPK
jgi:hypothetical protein